jgi:hypothetical protein
MERYFILMIAVTLVGVTVRKNRRETDSCSIRQEERKMIPIPCENGLNYTNVLTTYIKLKTSSDVVIEAKSYEIVANKNSIQKIIKSWTRRVNKMSRSTNPRVLFNILSTLPMGEPCFIQ